MTTITIDTAATLAGTTPRRIKRMIHKRLFPTVEVGDRILIQQDRFQAWIAAGGMKIFEKADRAEERRRAAYRVKRARQAVNP